MKKKLSLALALFALTSLSAWAIGPVDISLDFVSRYIWRGMDLNMKKPALQPGVSTSIGPATIGFWGSISFEDKNLTETDFYLDFGIPLPKPMSLNVGLTYYGWYWADNFDFGKNTSPELYVTAGLGVILSPTISLYYDFDNGDGYGSGLYVLLGLSQTLFSAGVVKVNVDATAGFVMGGAWLLNSDASGLSDLNLKLSVPVSAGPVTLTPFAVLTVRTMDEVKGGDDDAVFWFGLSASL